MSARTPSLGLEIQHVVKIRKGAKCGKKETRTKSLRLSELFIAALLPHSSLTSLETPAALRWLSSSNYPVGSTLTQLRLYSSSSSSSAPASSVKSKTSSLTSTPTRLQNRYQHKLCSDCFFIYFFPSLAPSSLSSVFSMAPRPDWCQHRLSSDTVMSRRWPGLRSDSEASCPPALGLTHPCS